VNALFINGHETSIGHLYDLDATRLFCQDRDCLHIVDAIGLFGTDQLDMTKSKIDILIISANKGLAVAPGISMIALSPKALSRIITLPPTYYFDINVMLSDGLRGQTPFTPAIGVLLQLNQRLEALVSGGIDISITKAAKLARHFRTNITRLPLRAYSQSMPNAMTALEVFGARISARAIVDLLDVHYDLVVAPNGGSIGESVFRVAHMGNLCISDVDRLIKALTKILE
jgi:aspartate aminotransferase-like enzyme